MVDLSLKLDDMENKYYTAKELTRELEIYNLTDDEIDKAINDYNIRLIDLQYTTEEKKKYNTIASNPYVKRIREEYNEYNKEKLELEDKINSLESKKHNLKDTTKIDEQISNLKDELEASKPTTLEKIKAIESDYIDQVHKWSTPKVQDLELIKLLDFKPNEEQLKHLIEEHKHNATMLNAIKDYALENYTSIATSEMTIPTSESKISAMETIALGYENSLNDIMHGDRFIKGKGYTDNYIEYAEIIGDSKEL